MNNELPPVAGPADAPTEHVCGMRGFRPMPPDNDRCPACEESATQRARPADALDEAFEASLPPDRQFARRDARRIIAELSRPADAVRPPDELQAIENLIVDYGDARQNIQYDNGVRAFALRCKIMDKVRRASVEAQREAEEWKEACASAQDKRDEAIQQAVEAQEDAPIISDIRRVIREEIGNAGIADASLLVAVCAQRFCAELQEDADGVPSVELAELHDALDKWDAACEKAGTTRSGLPHAATKPAPENA